MDVFQNKSESGSQLLDSFSFFHNSHSCLKVQLYKLAPKIMKNKQYESKRTKQNFNFQGLKLKTFIFNNFQMGSMPVKAIYVFGNSTDFCFGYCKLRYFTVRQCYIIHNYQGYRQTVQQNVIVVVLPKLLRAPNSENSLFVHLQKKVYLF